MVLGVFSLMVGLVLGSVFLRTLVRLGCWLHQVLWGVILRSIARPRFTPLGGVLWDFTKGVSNPQTGDTKSVVNNGKVSAVNFANVKRKICDSANSYSTVEKAGNGDLLGDKQLMKAIEYDNVIGDRMKCSGNTFDKMKYKGKLKTAVRSHNVVGNVAEIITVSVMKLRVDSLPDISRACSQNNFSCYRTVIPWMTRINRDIGFIMNDILPEFGPISSVELGSVLGQLVCDFRITDMKLPSLINTTVDGAVYLHFDSAKMETINITICKLFSFNGFVGASLEPTAMIKAAASVGAPTIASNEASALFREQLSSMVKVETVLTSDDQDIINRERSHVRYLQNHNVTNDHPLMAAYREIIRNDFDHMFNVRKTRLRTLILGASSREIRLYNNNKNVFFQIALREGKDMNRFVTDCLSDLKESKAKKLHKKRATGSEQVLKRATDDVVTVKYMIEEWKHSKKLPDRFMLWDESIELFKGRLGNNNFDIIIFQDVGYNYDETEWLRIFASTGASSGYGYMCLPWELIEPNLIPSNGYMFKTDGVKSKLAYYGYANGYVHDTNAWSTLMKSLVMRGRSFSIVVEFVARIGPMTCVRLVKSNIDEIHVRNLEVPEFLRTVQVLDIVESFDYGKQKLDLNNLKYFPVKASEFHDVVNYALDVAKESINFNTILLYIRRRCSGISLVTKDIAKSWTAPRHKLPAFALVVYLYTNHMIGDFGNLQAKHHMSMPSKFRLFLRRTFVETKIIEMFKNYYQYFLDQDLFHVLVKDVNKSFWQEGRVKASNKPLLVYNEPNPEDLLDLSDEEEQFDDECAICVILKNVCGDQVFTCDRSLQEIYRHDFGLNDEELTKMKATLSDTAKDNPGIKSIKEVALARVPPSNFSHMATLYYISGPPGTGKSYIIRALATRDDLVITPFARLKQDYTNFVHPITKVKTSLRCYTQHAAFTALNHPRIFVDEYTAMPYEFLAVIVNNCAAEEVFLVGDHRQVHLINEVEGVSISSKVDLGSLRSHELVRNYRNPKDAVFVLNTIYMYNMVNMKDFEGFKFDTTLNYNLYEEYTPLFFRYSTAERFGVDSDTCQKVTVRSNQGATYSKVKLIITENDKDVFNIPSMAIVALSRHTDECVVLSDGTAVSNSFVQMLISCLKDPRVAELPKLSPICNIGECFGLVANPKMKFRNKGVHIIDEDGIVHDSVVDSSEEMTEVTRVRKVFVVEPKYKLKSKTLLACYDLISNVNVLNKLLYFIISASKFIYKILIFIRDSDVNTIKDISSFIVSYVRTKIFLMFFEEDKVTCEEAEIDQLDLGHENKIKIKRNVVGIKDPQPKVFKASYSKPNREDQSRKVSGKSPVKTKRTVVNKQSTTEQNPNVEDIDFKSKSVNEDNIIVEEVDLSGKNEHTEAEGHDLNGHSKDDVTCKNGNQDINQDNGKHDLQKLPNENICMLQALGNLSNNKIEDVWQSMLLAVGKEKVEELYNNPWSTDEMEKFCYLNNLTVTVVMDDKNDIGCVYGTGQNHIGTIDYSSKGVGHFYVKPEDRSKKFKIKLCVDENDINLSKQKFDKLYINHDTLKQFSTSGDTVYNSYIYDLMINYMTEGILEEMVGGETEVFNNIGLCNAIVIKGTIPTKFSNLKNKPTTEEVLRKISIGFSKPILVVDMTKLSLSFVITKEHNYLDEINMCRPLSDFLKSENVCLSGFDKFMVSNIIPRDLSHLPRNEIVLKFHIIVFSTVRKLNMKKFLAGGNTPQLHPFVRYSAVRAKEVTYIPLKSAEEGFKTMARLFSEPIYLTSILVEDKLKDDNEYVPIENTSFDAFRMLFEDMATIDENNFQLANQEALGYLGREFGNGVINLTTFDNMNQKFKSLNRTESAWSLLNVAPGVTYFKSHLTQSLYCLQMRYLTRAFISTHNIQSIEKAREIAELFFYEHMELNFDIFNEQDLYETILESEKAMEEKHYDKQADFEVSGDTAVRFSMKDIFKPFKTTIDLFKPGQGISAWSKNLQTIFQTSFRIINKHFINCLSPHVVFDNGIDEYALMLRVNALLKLLPDIAVNGVIDATACDSGQNKFTQMIERVILEKLGVNDYFLDWYYSHREEYLLKGYNVTATINDIKTSGEPATLLNNTILMACLMNYLIRGDGPSVIVIKGDDGLKRQLNLRCNDDVLPVLRNYLKMDFKIDINVPITFCGYFLSGSNLVPDIVRKCFKIAGHRFRDYEHFTEYQQSLRDWVLTVNKMDTAYVCGVTASSYKLGYEFVSSLFESIVSLTHINERQFRTTFKYKRFNWIEDYEHSTPWKDKLPWYQG
uniref:Replicase n=1 Tax=Dactylorhiza hatagirea beny-like virus TaxID=2765867 RepID=A0A8D9PH41_9VIRU|nr:TPA_exp: replicase [Dactylorhiza hatagirea beny-like virus]